MADVLTICFVIFAILLFSMLLDHSDKSELRASIRDLHADIRDLRTEMNSRFDSLRREMSTSQDRVHSELRSLHGPIGELKRRIDTITKREP